MNRQNRRAIKSQQRGPMARGTASAGLETWAEFVEHDIGQTAAIADIKGIAKQYAIPAEEVARMVEEVHGGCRYFRNGVFEVELKPADVDDWVHLSICRSDGGAGSVGTHCTASSARSSARRTKALSCIPLTRAY